MKLAIPDNRALKLSSITEAQRGSEASEFASEEAQKLYRRCNERLLFDRCAWEANERLELRDAWSEGGVEAMLRRRTLR